MDSHVVCISESVNPEYCVAVNNLDYMGRQSLSSVLVRYDLHQSIGYSSPVHRMTRPQSIKQVPKPTHKQTDPIYRSSLSQRKRKSGQHTSLISI